MEKIFQAVEQNFLMFSSISKYKIDCSIYNHDIIMMMDDFYDIFVGNQTIIIINNYRDGIMKTRGIADEKTTCWDDIINDAHFQLLRVYK